MHIHQVKDPLFDLFLFNKTALLLGNFFVFNIGGLPMSSEFGLLIFMFSSAMKIC